MRPPVPRAPPQPCLWVSLRQKSVDVPLGWPVSPGGSGRACWGELPALQQALQGLLDGRLLVVLFGRGREEPVCSARKQICVLLSTQGLAPLGRESLCFDLWEFFVCRRCLLSVKRGAQQSATLERPRSAPAGRPAPAAAPARTAAAGGQTPARRSCSLELISDLRSSTRHAQ